jgi:hypothetical protein
VGVDSGRGSCLTIPETEGFLAKIAKIAKVGLRMFLKEAWIPACAGTTEYSRRWWNLLCLAHVARDPTLG